RVADELDARHLDDRPLGDVEDDAGVAELAALDQLAAGEGPAVLVVAAHDRLAGHLVGDRVARRARAQAGDGAQLLGLEVARAGARARHAVPPRSRARSSPAPRNATEQKRSVAFMGSSLETGFGDRVPRGGLR